MLVTLEFNRIYFYYQQQIREAIICIAIEEVEFLNS
jgi:hypothetical protein